MDRNGPAPEEWPCSPQQAAYARARGKTWTVYPRWFVVDTPLVEMTRDRALWHLDGLPAGRVGRHRSMMSRRLGSRLACLVPRPAGDSERWVWVPVDEPTGAGAPVPAPAVMAGL